MSLVHQYKLSRYGVPDFPVVRQAVENQVQKVVRRSARRKKPGSSFWDAVARSVSAHVATRMLVVIAKHKAARFKETGGTVHSRYSQQMKLGGMRGIGKYTKWHRRRHGKWLKVPISGRGTGVLDAIDLEWRPNRGSRYLSQVGALKIRPTRHDMSDEEHGHIMRLASGLGRRGGTFFLPGNRRGVLGRKVGNTFQPVYALFSSLRIGPDKWYPSKRKIAGAIRHGKNIGIRQLKIEMGKQAGVIL